jgi:hypothetical protein
MTTTLRRSSVLFVAFFFVVAFMLLLNMLASLQPVNKSGAKRDVPMYQPFSSKIDVPDGLEAPVLTEESTKSRAREVANLKTADLDIAVSHGTTKHPYEADETRRCLDNRGPLMIFKMGHLYARICDLGPKETGDKNDRWFGFQIVGKSGSNWFESTAYVPKLVDSTLFGLLDWLYKQGWERFGK